MNISELTNNELNSFNKMVDIKSKRDENLKKLKYYQNEMKKINKEYDESVIDHIYNRTLLYKYKLPN